MKRTELRRRTPQRAADERTYLRRSREWLVGKVCANCGTAEGLTVHHMRGRVGADLLRQEFWLALCSGCHKRATENPLWAYENGYSLRRIGAA